MKNHVTSLELSKKLKEAGFEAEHQNTYYAYGRKQSIPQYLATELLDAMPSLFKKQRLKVWKTDTGEYMVEYPFHYAMLNKSLPDALAQMILQLKQGYFNK